jgi:hypothetical protein
MRPNAGFAAFPIAKDSTPPPMKHTLHLLSLGMLITVLSSCDTYVDARADTHSRPGHWDGHTHTRTHTDHYYSGRPSNRRSGSLINANTNIGLGL